MGQTFPLPITPAMLARANANEGKPRYDSMTDWFGGQFGNEVDQAEATQAIANSHSANVETDYDPQHQKAKAKDMVPPRAILNDLGKDYGTYAGGVGRTGPVQPRAPYPDATSPPIVTSVMPASGVPAGGTAITIYGGSFTGATGVTIGGTAATSVVVVSTNTVTAVTPAKAAGNYDLVVATPRGNTPAGYKFFYT